MQIKKYIKKPVEVYAIQFLTENLGEVVSFLNDVPHKVISSEMIIIVCTMDGEFVVRHGDYVVKGVYDEFYTIKPTIFEETYKEVNN